MNHPSIITRARTGQSLSLNLRRSPFRAQSKAWPIAATAMAVASCVIVAILVTR
jgi:negative regulator of sigma E activity